MKLNKKEAHALLNAKANVDEILGKTSVIGGLKDNKKMVEKEIASDGERTKAR